MTKNILTDSEIHDRIADIIVEALRIDKSIIKMDSRLFLELAAESIDILDIRFRIETAFGIKIDQSDLIKSVGEGLSAQEIQERFTVALLIAYIKKQIEQL